MDEKIKVGGVDAGDPYGLKFFSAVSQMQDELAALRAENERLRGELRRIAEGNLGDEPWQASYEVIRHVAKDALK